MDQRTESRRELTRHCSRSQKPEGSVQAFDDRPDRSNDRGNRPCLAFQRPRSCRLRHPRDRASADVPLAAGCSDHDGDSTACVWGRLARPTRQSILPTPCHRDFPIRTVRRSHSSAPQSKFLVRLQQSAQSKPRPYPTSSTISLSFAATNEKSIDRPVTPTSRRPSNTLLELRAATLGDTRRPDVTRRTTHQTITTECGILPEVTGNCD